MLMLENVESIATVGQCMANYFELKFEENFEVVMLISWALNIVHH